MAELELWEKILIGIMAAGVIWLFLPGVRASVERSKNAEKNWPALIVPLLVVILFVIGLMVFVRGS